MADIHSRVILDDQASNPLAGYITVAKNAASATTAAQRQLKSYESALRSTELASAKATAAFEASAQQLDAMRAAGEAGTAAYKQLETQNERLRLKVEALGTQTGILTGKARETQAAVEKEAAAIREQADAAEKASKSTKELSDNQKAATSSADALASAVKRLAASYLSIQGLKRAVDLSDSLVSTRARLDRMNDGLQTTQQLETMIYQSAQRSRGNFMDTMGLVSQLGTMAGSAFDNTKEIVQFAEQLNKQLALSGASGQAAQAAILQMEQGLASGVLRGDELNSVMEQAPAIARSIADYLQVDMGKLREMGAQGQITAAIVKNAMFAAAAETNAEFAKTPMTWAQVWTVASNAAIRALDPLLSAINWVANNIQTVVPIVISLGTAFGVLLIAANWTNILAFASEKAAAAQGLNIYISSGYRSYSRQQTLYNNYVKSDGKALADTYSSRPGYSEHQTGLCFDLNTIDDSFGNTKESAWLEQHAQEYGFIIRFPKGKDAQTGYQYEPWHLRYLGIDMATKVYNSGLSLEEYLGITSEYAD